MTRTPHMVHNARHTEKTKRVTVRIPVTTIADWQSAAVSEGLSMTLWLLQAGALKLGALKPATGATRRTKRARRK